MIRRASSRHELATTRVGLVHDLQAKRARRTDEATSPGGDARDRACASRANHRPIDALRRLASRPRHVRHGPMMRLRARHPTRNRVYTLASPPSGASPKVSEKKQTNPGRFGAAPGESSDPPAETRFWARPAHARGACRRGRVWRGGSRVREGPWARARPPRPSHGQLCPGQEAQDPEGRPHLGKRPGGRARARPPPRRAPGRPSLSSPGPGPVFDAPRKRSFWAAPVMSPGVRRARKRPCRARDRQDCGRGEPRAA